MGENPPASPISDSILISVKSGGLTKTGISLKWKFLRAWINELLKSHSSLNLTVE